MSLGDYMAKIYSLAPPPLNRNTNMELLCDQEANFCDLWGMFSTTASFTLIQKLLQKKSTIV